MNQEIEKLLKELLAEIASSSTWGSTVAPHITFQSCERIISLMARLNSFRVSSEMAYRRKLIEFLDTKKVKATADGERVVETSYSEADARAKATQEYDTHRRVENIFEIANEQIMAIKKWADVLKVDSRM